MKKAILISFILFISLLVKAQIDTLYINNTFDKDKKISGIENKNTNIQPDWSFGISLAPNYSLHVLQTSGFFFPFSNTMKLGYSIDFVAKNKWEENLFFITGLSYNAITFEYNAWGALFHKNDLTFSSFGIPLLLEITSSKKKKISFNFNFGVQLGIISNVQDISTNINNQSTGYIVDGGGFVFYGVIGLGLEYKITNNFSLFLEPELFQDFRPLTYDYKVIGNPKIGQDNSDNYTYHNIQFFKVLSIEYIF